MDEMNERFGAMPSVDRVGMECAAVCRSKFGSSSGRETCILTMSVSLLLCLTSLNV